MKFSFKSNTDINQSLEIVVPIKDIEEQVSSKLKAAQKDSKLKGFRKVRHLWTSSLVSMVPK